MAIRVGSHNQLAPQVLDSMHRFRRQAFVERLGWALPRLAYDKAERVTACARLLPTTCSYMLPELFPQLLGGAPAPRRPGIWELSRIAADVSAPARVGNALSVAPFIEVPDSSQRDANADLH